MEWFRENWFWVVFGGLFLWMHMRMHGGHGHHGGHGGHHHSGSAADPTRTHEEEHHAQH